MKYYSAIIDHLVNSDCPDLEYLQDGCELFNREAETLISKWCELNPTKRSNMNTFDVLDFIKAVLK